MRVYVLALVGLVAAGCARSVNVDQERAALMTVDHDWSQSAKDAEKFASFLASDVSVYITGMPAIRGQAAVKDTFTKLLSAPGWGVQWTPGKAEVSGAGDIGYTTGTYQISPAGGGEKGKYVTVWKKQSDGTWKVAEDIFNADAAPGPTSGPHVVTPAAKVTWGPAPPVLQPGAKMAVISGDPSKDGPFVIRAQLPAGYVIAPHWHPTDEHVTVLSGTIAIGMGDTVDKGDELSPGGYAALPAQMHHYLTTKGAATIQVHGMGPFAITYVNPADDPSKKK